MLLTIHEHHHAYFNTRRSLGLASIPVLNPIEVAGTHRALMAQETLGELGREMRELLKLFESTENDSRSTFAGYDLAFEETLTLRGHGSLKGDLVVKWVCSYVFFVVIV